MKTLPNYLLLLALLLTFKYSYSQPIPKECFLNDFIYFQHFSKQNNDEFLKNNYRTVIVKKIEQVFSYGVWSEPTIISVDTFKYTILNGNCQLEYFSQNGKYFEKSNYITNGDTIFQNVECFTRSNENLYNGNAMTVATLKSNPLYYYTRNSEMPTGFRYKNEFNKEGKVTKEQIYDFLGMESDLIKHSYKDTVEFLERYFKSNLTGREEYIYNKQGKLLIKNKFLSNGEKKNYKKFTYDKKGRILKEYDDENSYQVGMFYKAIDNSYQYSTTSIDITCNNNTSKIKYYSKYILGEKGNILSAEKANHFAKYLLELKYNDSPFLPTKVILTEEPYMSTKSRKELIIEYLK